MNTPSTRPSPNRQIIEEASSWFVDFRVGDIDARRRQEFRDWLRRSPDHIQAYLDIAMTYAELPTPGPKGEIDVQALIDYARSSDDTNIVPLDLPASEVSHHRRLGAHSTSVSKRVLAIAASVVLAVALGSWHYIQRETYSTAMGEQRSLTLADGSTVELNSRSRIRVRYTDHERHIELVDGQALFQVAKNKQRPFIVHIGDTQVRAVGTQFDVYRKHTGTVVTVVEGRVAVLPSSEALDLSSEIPYSREEQENPNFNTREKLSALGPENSGLILSAGEQLTVGQKAVTKPQAVNPNTATAWTQRQLIFENSSLNEVAEEFNRYSARPIIVEVHTLDYFHVSGTYSSSNPESLLRFLRVQPGIKLIETDREIRIARQ